MTDYQPNYTASHAIIIGINSYADPRFAPLGEAESDARAIADILAAPPYSFSIESLLGAAATRQEILRALFRLRRSGPDDRILIYFAGHGYTLLNRFGAETGYLAAADTIPEQDFTAVRLDEVTDLRLHAEAKHIAFIFDACFSGQALGLTRAPSSAADKFLTRRAYQVISAGAADQPVSDYHSMTDLMLHALEGELPGGLLTVSRLGLYLQQAMAADSGHTQIPQFGHLRGSQGGEFVIRPRGMGHFTDSFSAAINASSWQIRSGAVSALAEMLADGDPERAEFARSWLAQIAADEAEDDRVRRAAAQSLQNGTPVAQPIILPEPEEAPLIQPVLSIAPAPDLNNITATQDLKIKTLSREEFEQVVHSDDMVTAELGPTRPELPIGLTVITWAIAWAASGTAWTTLYNIGVPFPAFALMALGLGGVLEGTGLGIALGWHKPHHLAKLAGMAGGWAAINVAGFGISVPLTDNLSYLWVKLAYRLGGDLIGSFVSSSYYFVPAYLMIGLAGGMLTGLLVRMGGSRWAFTRPLAIIVIGWMLAFNAAAFFQYVLLENLPLAGWMAGGAISGAVAGAIGAAAMFTGRQTTKRPAAGSSQ